MASILLPTKPLPQSASPAPIVFGGWQTPPTGGAETWLGFMGNRLSLAITTPRLKPEPDGRLWTAALLDGWLAGAIVGCRFPQPGFAIGSPGSIVVAGADQSGSILQVRGGTPNYEIRRRQFFSLVHQGRRYLHYATANYALDGAGAGSVPIGPMLRIQPDDGDACEFGVPMIEGKLGGDAKSWTMVIARVQGLNFTISETR